MPLYEYECDDCGHRFERIRKFSDPPLTICPECDGPIRKLLSPPAIQFKGTGWYVTDYARKSGDGKAAEGAGEAGKDAEVGERGGQVVRGRQVRGTAPSPARRRATRPLGERLVRLGRRREAERLGRSSSSSVVRHHVVGAGPARGLHRRSESEAGRVGRGRSPRSVDSQRPAAPRAAPSASSITGARSGRFSAKWIVASR